MERYRPTWCSTRRTAASSAGPIALVVAEGRLDMRSHPMNDRGELMTGVCRSTPELLPNGRIRLHEAWRWTSGDGSSGSSVVEEVG